MAKGFKSVRVCVSGKFDDDPAKIKQWVVSGGGDFQTKVNGDTTHLVVSESHWKNKTDLVKEALSRKIHVIKYDWLHESLMNQSKKAEKPYLWITAEEREAKRNKQKVKQESKDAEKAEKDAQRKRKRAAKEEEKKQKASGKINYTKALAEHTDAFMGAEEREAYRKSQVSQAQSTTSGPSSPSAASSKAAKTFRQGARQAKTDLLSDNHHIYVDETGFRYDIPLIKTDIMANKNERVTLTMYESNSHPHTYATHVKQAGTLIAPSSKVEAVLGSNYPTAFRVFKKVFQDKSGIAWTERFTECATAQAAREARAASSINALKESRAKRASAKGKGAAEEKRGKEVLGWDERPFIYRLPAEGLPRGAMPEGAAQLGGTRVAVQSIEGGFQGRGVKVEEKEQEFMMSGANGKGIVGSSEGNAQVIEDDAEEDEDEEEVAAEKEHAHAHVDGDGDAPMAGLAQDHRPAVQELEIGIAGEVDSEPVLLNSLREYVNQGEGSTQAVEQSQMNELIDTAPGEDGSDPDNCGEMSAAQVGSLIGGGSEVSSKGESIQANEQGPFGSE